MGTWWKLEGEALLEKLILSVSLPLSFSASDFHEVSSFLWLTHVPIVMMFLSYHKPKSNGAR